ncbi:amidohydrolase family protein [Roseomonas elaeocarpi]|uniref:Amidohydrolase family protein n=1 Tax=Roseomonas elaeocarpi TaxID=907779 RepID=A0ABV6K090_9PROT
MATAAASPYQGPVPREIVDAHHHFWDLRQGHYPWLQEDYEGERFFLGEYRQILRDYLPDDLRHDAAPWNVVQTVHVEAEHDRGDQLGETRWLEALHGRTGLPSALVGHVFFHQPDAQQVLEAQARSPLMRGIRSKPVTAATPDGSVRGQPGTMDDPRWLEGLARLPALGLSWDLRVPWWHLAEAAAVVRQVPGLRVVLNHCGLPLDRSAEGLAAWRRGMAALADCADVSVKLSEMGLRGGVWDHEGNIGVVRDTVAIFGHERAIFASNLPVSGLSAPFGTIMDAVLRGLDAREQRVVDAVFAGNARRIYRLEEPPAG